MSKPFSNAALAILTATSIAFGDEAFNPIIARDVWRGLVTFAEKNPDAIIRGGPMMWVPRGERGGSKQSK